MQGEQRAEKELVFINLLKLLAILLVINSHCSALYPYEALVTGGALGNGLFFIISGFLYARSFDGEIPRFGEWYKKRILKIVPVTYIYLLVTRFSQLKELIVAKDIGQLLWMFVFPTYYWFMGAFCLFLVAYYFIVRSRSRYAMPVAFAVLLAMYVVAYILFVDRTRWSVEDNDSFFRWIYYFAIMLAGAILYRRREQARRVTAWKALVAAILAVIVMYADKYAMTRSDALMRMQWINQACVMAFCVFAMIWGLSMENARLSYRGNGFSKLGMVAKLSWEIYLVHRTLVPILANVVFPVNIAALLLLTLVLAFALHWLENFVSAKYRSRRGRLKGRVGVL